MAGPYPAPVRTRRPALPAHLRALRWAPVITIHGDTDETVPYSQPVRLHRALDKRNVPNRLFTLHGAGHGGFTPHELTLAYAAIFDFLRARGLPTAAATPILGVATK